MVKANSLVQQNRRIGFHGLFHTRRDGSALSKWKTHISARTVQGQKVRWKSVEEINDDGVNI